MSLDTEQHREDARDARIAELERRLEAAEQRFEETQRLARVGSWELIVDSDGECHASWSRELQRIFGRDPGDPPPTVEELIEVVHPDDRRDFEALVDRVRTSSGPFQHTYRLVDRFGEIRYLEARGAVEESRSGFPRRSYGATQDISELRRSQEQLERAQRLESVGQLAGGVAHDFNNLLAVILNNAECLAEEVRDAPGRERVGEIESAARTAAELTRRLLLFSRRDPSELRRIDLAAAVRDAEALLRRTLGEHIELTVDADPDLPPVRLAAGQVEQILVNLAINARDALPPEGGSIAVTVRRSPTVPILMLRVADDGLGMSEEVVEQAFDPFFTTKPRGQGTGLGLAAVYGIVGRAGGHVEIESEPGNGTEVSVYLPVAEERADGVVPGPVRSAPAAADGRTVLVVDNEEAVQRIVSHMLAKHGYRVHTASAAREAEAVLERAGEVDLLLTDLLMPEVSGRELVARLRERGIELPTVFMSGYGEDPSPLGPWDEPATVLQKPFKADELLRTVGDALGPAKSGR